MSGGGLGRPTRPATKPAPIKMIAATNHGPKSVLDGKDPQLERGIAEVMAKLKQPVKLPAKPPGPVKTIR